MQAIFPINTHTKFGKDRINTFPSNERKPSVRTSDGGKSKNNMSTPSGVDIKIEICHTQVLGSMSVTPSLNEELNSDYKHNILYSITRPYV